MIAPGSLVLFKTQIARIASCAEGKLLLELESGESIKVREKDVRLLHPGPVSRIPATIEEGDFTTAHAMLASDHKGRDPVPTTWKELAELVFGEYSPQAAAACARHAASGELFRIGDSGPLAQSLEEIDRIRKKDEEKRQETQRRTSFIASLRTAIRQKGDENLKKHQEYSRYIADLESYALGSGERSPLAAEAGINESRESVHQALIDSGLWQPSVNPWPARAGCPLWPPKMDFPEEERSDRAMERRDLRHLASYAIDNAWSTDPDDAIAFEDSLVWVHIADPAAFIAPSSPVDAEALARGATLYLPERIVPMLPEGTIQRLGLGIGETSPALSFGIRLGQDGSPAETIIVPSIVRVTRLSYEEGDALFASGDTTLASLDAVAKLRHRRRLANGAVDIDMPETSMKVEGDDIRFLTIPTTRAAEIVREMMLLAGEAAARWAYERKLPFTYSSQEAPQLPKDLPRSDEEAGATASQPLLSLQYQRRKGMKASIVGTECLAHQGLGLSFYSQVTSPLRRYQDLLAHHQIRAYLSSGIQGALTADEVSRRCILAGQASASTRQAERDSRLHWICCYLTKHPEWKGEAFVLDIRDRDAWIIVPSLGYESSLRTRQTLQLDETVTVSATRASIAMHDISFDLA
ncbi:MAG: RNB domain-containing ribonuclease [Rectinemataceae bacterium]|nr:RNB domain-containing ribonuclease [Rectinemataceae bacterium]